MQAISAMSNPVARFLEKHPDFYKTLLDNLYDAVYFVDPERHILYWNHAAEALTGYAAAEVVGKRCSDDVLCHVDESGRTLCRSECPVSRSMKLGIPSKADAYLRCRDGHRLAVSVRVVPILDENGTALGAVEVFSDIALRKRLERRNVQLNKLAFLDPLTRLVNRRFLDSRIRQSLNELSTFGRSFGVVLADLDGFKEVNDSFGHKCGDMVLELVARTLSSSIRAGDTLGRWGGDEFLAILPDVDEPGTLHLAQRCRTLVRSSFLMVGGTALYPTVSVGATVITASDTEESLFRRVDQALYQSKNEGRNRTTFLAE
jgi:diguanylate cyclase (GGDEF)-like protein/PAS domain S-box-containing protein